MSLQQILDREIKYLPGVGPKRAQILKKELEIETYKDLLYHFPYKYIDRTKFHQTNEIHSEQAYVQLKGRITGFRIEGKRPKQRLIAKFADENGQIELVWFQGLSWVQNNLKPGVDYVIFGKPNVFNRKVNIPHPETEELKKYQENPPTGFKALYSTTEKLKKNYINQRTIQKLQINLLKEIQEYLNEETLPQSCIKDFQLLNLKDALINIHFPKNIDLLEKAQYRLKFEELFYIQINILKQKDQRNKAFKGLIFEEVGSYVHQFYNENLPFALTNAQKRVIKEIRKDLRSGRQMNRLLQGDVGSGKTLVALMIILIALDNQFQACLMVPTEILANQHFATIRQFLSNLDIEIRLLTGSSKKKEREEIHEKLKSGSLQLLIGTHALLESPVQFKNLGMVVIDEQHRFGVAQRAKLWQKNTSTPPHILVMTATPIPRTLAMTLYGDLDVSVIDELPPGRKPIKTMHFYDSSRLKVHGFMKKQLAAGQQIYVVYPLISESESMDYKDLEDGYESISRAFPPPQYHVTIAHGKMKPEEKDKAMNHFKSGRANILVATTVIEVGVDVPNASVMIIESAERFGLSQLHQLRGRVGRGADQSYCILMTGHKLTNDARKRLSTMIKTNNGFEIAEADMKLRGPGDIEGTQQSGIPFNLKIANLGKDGDILQTARNAAIKITNNDPEFKSPDNQIIKEQLTKNSNFQFQWSVIS